MSKGTQSLRKKRQSGPTQTVSTQKVFESNFQTRVTLDDLVVDDELRAFIPPLQEEESELLEDSIRQEGVRDALLFWQHPEKGAILVDGHNRYAILKALTAEGLSPKVRINSLDFKNYEEVKDWMVINQLGRRNLTDEQRSYLRGLRYNREKDRRGGDRKSKDQIDTLNTSERLAKEYNVGEATIKRDSDLANGIDKIGKSNPALKRAVLSGSAKIKKAQLQALGRYNGSKLPKFKTPEDIQAYVLDITKKPKKAAKREKIPNSFAAMKKEAMQSLRKLRRSSKISEIEVVQAKLKVLAEMLKE